MTPEKIERVMELVRLYGEVRTDRYYSQHWRQKDVGLLRKEEYEALAAVRAAITDEGEGGE